MKDPEGTLILECHRHGEVDGTPLQFITKARLDYYMKMEAQLRALFGLLEVGPGEPDAVQPKTP